MTVKDLLLKFDGSQFRIQDYYGAIKYRTIVGYGRREDIEYAIDNYGGRDVFSFGFGNIVNGCTYLKIVI